jgi:hypothetical protein
VFKGYLREGTKSEKGYSGMQLELGKETLRYWKRQKGSKEVCLDLLLVWLDDTCVDDKDKEHKKGASSTIFQILGPEQVIKVVANDSGQKAHWVGTLRTLITDHIRRESKQSMGFFNF